MEATSFIQIGAILGLALLGGLLAKSLRQPVIVAYIAVGVLAGPSVFDLVSEDSGVNLLAQLGIAMLLFLVGLKLDIHLIRAIGVVALVTGVGQVVLTAGLGYLIAIAFGWAGVSAIYIAAALTFSSTIIVVKLLGDRRELDRLHGRIAVGILIVQDILVVLMMLVIVSLGRPGESLLLEDIALTMASGLGLLAFVWVIARWVLPRLLRWIAKSAELTLVFGVSWAVALAAASAYLGLSMEIGAFVAGVSLASSPYRESLATRLIALRDIMVLFFFIELGSSLSIQGAWDQLIPAMVISLIVLVAKPAIVLGLMSLLRYRPHTGLRTGLTISQISEFSLILVALGFSLGQLGTEVVSLITLVAIFTITLSTYLIAHQERIINVFSPLLASIPHPSSIGQAELAATLPYDAIVLGAGRLGSDIVKGLAQQGSKLLVVDVDPRALAAIEGPGIDTLYGDASEPDFLRALPINETDTIVCTAPERTTNVVVLKTLLADRFGGKICLTALDRQSAEDFAAYPQVTVIRPYQIAAHTVVKRLTTRGDAADTVELSIPPGV